MSEQLVPPFSKKEIEKIAREACYNYIDLSRWTVDLSSGSANLTIDSGDFPDIKKFLSEVFDNYKSDKATLLKMSAIIPVGEGIAQKAEITSSDTAIRLSVQSEGVKAKTLIIVASNLLAVGGGDNQGAYIEINLTDVEGQDQGTAISFSVTTVA